MKGHKIFQYTHMGLLGLVISFPFFSLTGKTSEEAFTEIYDLGIWGRNEKGEGTSGGGSSPQATELYRSFIERFIDHYNIQSVVDVGCGDWSFSQLINWENVNYMGYDVVKYLVEKNREKFTQSNIHFFHGDATTTDLPPADLLICKDVLQHLSNEDILSFIVQLPKFKYCLITNDVLPGTLTSSNPNIYSGSYREIDLTQPPFHLMGNIALIYIAGPNTKQVLMIDHSVKDAIRQN